MKSCFSVMSSVSDDGFLDPHYFTWRGKYSILIPSFFVRLLVKKHEEKLALICIQLYKT